LKKYIPLLLAVLSVNLIGVLLRLMDYPVYLILLGFRFHLSLLLPFLFILHKLRGDTIKKEFTAPVFKKNMVFIISLFVIPGFIMLILYLIGYITSGDPVYFYEFGLSSVFDMPVYLVWNSINIMFFFFFLKYAADIKFNFFILLILVILLFAYYFIPVTNEFDLYSASGFVITAAVVSILITHYRNVYWFTIFLFTMLWLYFILFGTDNSDLIRILFASRYTSWEGFYNINQEITGYAYISYVSVIFITLFLLSLSKKNKSFS
jgi:hypothetical protein